MTKIQPSGIKNKDKDPNIFTKLNISHPYAPVPTRIQSDTTSFDAENTASLDTLAQLVTKAPDDDQFTVESRTKNGDINTLKKRARRNYLKTALTLSLVTASEQSKDSVLNKSYWNTFHCSNVLLSRSDGMITAKYCKNRWCTVCNSIRTAQSINKYSPTIDNWDQKRFVTLTLKTVKAEDLKERIDYMFSVFTKIKNAIRQRHRRGVGNKLVGIRKMEVTYSEKTNRYHPHFHLIIKDPDTANEVLSLWYQHNENRTYDGDPLISEKGQDNQPADKKSSAELFKYFTKLITESTKGDRVIYADALDVIFNAIKGRRVLQPFGFKALKIEEEDDETKAGDEANAVAVYTWIQVLSDWVDKETGEMLTGYIPGTGFKDLVTKKIIVRDGFNSS